MSVVSRYNYGRLELVWLYQSTKPLISPCRATLGSLYVSLHSKRHHFGLRPPGKLVQIIGT